MDIVKLFLRIFKRDDRIYRNKKFISIIDYYNQVKEKIPAHLYIIIIQVESFWS